ncbi:hypothetical protein PVAG01_06498 [Phlyctema vagabunda]|uniref:Uncharacterized protein n=1 Tax=Phlyctema vagabunda TaxID=108571 RepID=A0ABR4PG96_9HELO
MEMVDCHHITTLRDLATVQPLESEVSIQLSLMGRPAVSHALSKDWVFLQGLGMLGP